MFTILIQEKGGEQRRMGFNKPEVTIGRVQGNDIVLPKGNVSKRHARIVLKDGKFIIVDLKSTNGTYVNGRKITSPLVVKDSDKIYIGDFIVGVDESATGEPDGASETTAPPPGAERIAQGSPDARPPRPTELAPQPMPVPGMSGNMNSPMGAMRGGALGDSSPPSPPSPRPGPPRPAPSPSRDLGASREPLQPREPLQQREAPAPGTMPPIGAPPPRSGRPGGTMPPPMAPIPPMASPQPATMADPHFPPPPRAETRQPPPPPELREAREPQSPMAMPPTPAATPSYTPPLPASSSVPAHPSPPSGAQPAPVVPLAARAARSPQAVPLAKKIANRPLSAIGKRGVQLEPLDPKVVKMLDLQSNILERLRAKLDLDKVPMDRLHEEELWQKAERATIDLVETLETSGELPKYIDQDALIKETLNEALALGPLEDLFADEAIDEILIDRRDRLVVGKNGVMRGSGKAFSTDDVFERVVKRLVHEAGATIDEARPVVDLRMHDGTRLTAAVSPVAARGAVLALKKPAAAMPQLSELVAQGALSSGMADLLTTSIQARRNILVCGGNGSGKTTIVAALAAASPVGERVVSVEDVAELAIARDEWVQLEARPATDKDAVDVAALLEMALRLSPDRLVIGEVRGREALPLVHALNAQVDGAIVAATGEGANAVLGRIATLARSLGGAPDGGAAIRELVATAFELVVHVVRHNDGAIKIHSIDEIVGVTESSFETQTVFTWNGSAFVPTGAVPRFYAELESRGIAANQAVFRA